MGRSSPRGKKPDIPRPGPKTIIFSELPEETWEILLHALDYRVSYFKGHLRSLQNLDDPGLAKQIHHYEDTLRRLDDLRRIARTSVGYSTPIPDYP